MYTYSVEVLEEQIYIGTTEIQRSNIQFKIFKLDCVHCMYVPKYVICT